MSKRRRLVVGAVAAAVLVVGGVVLAWVVSGAHEVALSTAGAQFLSQSHGRVGIREQGRPPEGVYAYHGSGTDSLSLPPKTLHDGPLIPGTVTYGETDCWSWRLDFSDDHWQSATFCPHKGELLETARGGWYRWSLLALSVSDASSYRCAPAEIAVPGELAAGRRVRFSCTGTNAPLRIPPVTLAGWVQFERSGDVRVGGKEVAAVRILETARFSGGQSGTEGENTWYRRSDGLPLAGSWSTDVRTPSPLGESTLTASGTFELSNVVPQR